MKSIKVELFAPPDYWRLSPEQKKAFCNGCGPGSWKFDMVPDYPLGINFTEACNIHDYMYRVGKTLEDKKAADRVFLNNMVRIVDAVTDTTVVAAGGYWVAGVYYDAVKSLGGPAFWSGKNKPEELCEVEVDLSLELFPEVE